MFEIDEYRDDTDFVDDILLLVDERRDDRDDTEEYDLRPPELILDFIDFWSLDFFVDDLCDLTEDNCNDSPPLLDEVDDLIDFLSELCDFVSNE